MKDSTSEYKYLSGINSPEDVKKLNIAQCQTLCEEIRHCLISSLSVNGGHLASNLGTVELTVALHRAFNSPNDKIIFDVGHQCYTHKILTGRKDKIDTIRKKGGISGFPKPSESEHDISIAGHSSVSISTGYGVAIADTLKGDNNYTVAVLGDGALTGGMVFEALNNANRFKNRFIIILNDNGMSISKSRGSIARHLTIIRSRPSYFKFKSSIQKFFGKIPLIGNKIVRILTETKAALKNAIYKCTIFESFGFDYLGPIDGHDLEKLDSILEIAKSLNHPAVVHVKTVKGKGYPFAEHNPENFHGISPFDINTGEPLKKGKGFSDCFGEKICSLAEDDEKICAITAAMCQGTGLNEFKNRFKNRYFDVGIAEQHAATFAGGLAIGGFKPVFAVYSTFLQRAYDQIFHDNSIQNLNVVFAVDRAGLTGEDGETHQGIYDTSFLNSIPNITVFSPANFSELETALEYAVYSVDGLSAVRYPRGSEDKFLAEMKFTGNYSVLGDDSSPVTIVTYGRIITEVLKASEALKEQNISVKIIKLNKIKPIDSEAVNEAAKSERIFFVEEGIRYGGVGERFAACLLENGFKGEFNLNAIDDGLFPQMSVAEAILYNKLDSESIADNISRSLSNAKQNQT